MKKEINTQDILHEQVCPKEFTLRAIILGVLIGFILEALLLYLDGVLGLDMNIAPVASMLGIFLIPLFGGKTSQREVNIMQSTATAVAFAAYTMSGNYTPLLMMGEEFRVLPALFMLLMANAMGICFVSILRKQFVFDETLPFPMAVVCSVALEKVDDKKSIGAKLLFAGAAIGIIISLLQNFGILPLQFSLAGVLPAGIPLGFLIMPMVISIGYVVGAKIGFILMVTSLAMCLIEGPVGLKLGWFADPVVDISGLQNFNLPLVIGMSLVGGLIPLFKQRKALISSFQFKKKVELGDDTKDDTDYSMKLMAGLLLALNVIMIAFCHVYYGIGIVPMTLCMAMNLIIVIIAVRINAQTGMSAALALNIFIIIVAYALTQNMVFAMLVAFINFSIFILAQDTIIDLKVGSQIGSSPANQIKGQFIGILCGSIVGVGMFYAIIKTYGLGGDLFTFPFGSMYYSIASGIAEGGVSGVFDLGRFALGGVLGVAFTAVGLPATVIALALYIAPASMLGVALGGILRLIVEKTKGADFASEGNNIATGLIIGDAIVCIIMVVINLFVM